MKGRLYYKKRGEDARDLSIMSSKNGHPVKQTICSQARNFNLLLCNLRTICIKLNTRPFNEG